MAQTVVPVPGAFTTIPLFHTLYITQFTTYYSTINHYHSNTNYTTTASLNLAKVYTPPATRREPGLPSHDNINYYYNQYH